MQRRYIGIIALVLLLALTSTAYANYYTSFVYTKFCTTDTTAVALDKAYTDIQVKITNKLVYADTSNASKILIANTTDAVKRGISVMQKQYGQNNNLYIYLFDGVNDFELYAGRWEQNDTILVQIKQSKVYAYRVDQNNTKTTLINGFSYTQTEGYSCIGAVGASGAGTGSFTGGYVQVDVTTPVSTSIDISAWIPLIFTLAMLGVVLGFVKKIGS